MKEFSIDNQLQLATTVFAIISGLWKEIITSNRAN